MYLFCLLIAIHNIIMYLVKGKRYLIKLMTCFYVLVTVILMTRVFSLIKFVQFISEQNECNIFAADELDTAATYLKALLGV